MVVAVAFIIIVVLIGVGGCKNGNFSKAKPLHTPAVRPNVKQNTINVPPSSLSAGASGAGPNIIARVPEAR